MSDPIVQRLLELGYEVKRDTVPVGSDFIKLRKTVEGKPSDGFRNVDLVRYDFSHLTQSGQRHVEWEVSSTFKTTTGNTVKVTFLQISEDELLKKLDSLEQEIAVAFVAMLGKYQE